MSCNYDTYYMGLDLSLRGTGYVVLSGLSQIVDSGIVGESLKKDASVKDHTERLIDTTKHLMDVMREWMAKGDLCVAIENYAFSKSSSSVTGLAELHGVIKSQMLLALGLSPVYYSVKTARKLVFGNGNFKKAKVKPALEARGLKFKGLDDADAFVIAECHMMKMKELNYE